MLIKGALAWLVRRDHFQWWLAEEFDHGFA